MDYREMLAQELLGLRPRAQDQPSAADRIQQLLEADRRANAARTPIIQPQNLDKNRISPDDVMRYRGMGLGYEAL